MAPVVMAIAAVASAAMSYQSYRQQKKAAKSAEEIGRQNAAMKEAETREAATRLKENQRRVLAEGRAGAAASGIAGGTNDIYLNDLANTQGRELAWMEKAGMSQANIMRQEAALTRQQGEAAATGHLSSAVGSLGKAAGGVYDYGVSQEWWGQ